jgi:hypothetical protein
MNGIKIEALSHDSAGAVSARSFVYVTSYNACGVKTYTGTPR